MSDLLVLAVWILVFLVYGLGDLLSTYIGIGWYDAREQNPVAQALLDVGGFRSLVVIKMGVLVAMFLAGVMLEGVFDGGILFVGTVVLAWGLYVLYNNASVIITHRR